MHVVQEDLESTALVLVEVSSGFLGPGVPAVASVTAEDGTAISEGRTRSCSYSYFLRPRKVNFLFLVLQVT